MIKYIAKAKAEWQIEAEQHGKAGDGREGAANGVWEFTDGEKLHSLWVSCCAGSADSEIIVKEGVVIDGQPELNKRGEIKSGTIDSSILENAIAEIEMTQAAKPNIRSTKTYHLLVSFREKEGDWPDLKTLQEIERRLIDAIGFTDHQRVCATHIDTNNFHMHIAINKIHPKTLLSVSPKHDFDNLDRASRACERDFGLMVTPGKQARSLNQFKKVLKAAAPSLRAAIREGADWQRLHQMAADKGFAIRRKGAGLVFINTLNDRRYRHEVKASDIDRNLTLHRIETALGAYVPDKVDRTVEDVDTKGRPGDRHDEQRQVAELKGRLRKVSLALVNVVKDASNWEDVHRGFAKRGFRLVRSGVGVAIAADDSGNSVRVAASVIDKRLALPRLEAVLGSFEARNAGHVTDFERSHDATGSKLLIEDKRASAGNEPDSTDNETGSSVSAGALVPMDQDPTMSEGAQDYESRSWEESFERHVKNLRPELDKVIERSHSWQDVHDGFALNGLRIKPRGSGLVITDETGDNRMKASSLHRSYSKNSLEAQFGAFEHDRMARELGSGARNQYTRRPLTRHPGQNKLWRKYLLTLAARPKRSFLAKTAWRAFLEEEQGLDPLAKAIVENQRRVTRAIVRSLFS